MARDQGVGLGALIAAKVICCGGLVLVATGALSTFGSWLITGGYIWIGAAAGAVVIGLLYRRPGRAGTQYGANAVGHPRPAEVVTRRQ